MDNFISVHKKGIDLFISFMGTKITIIIFYRFNHRLSGGTTHFSFDDVPLGKCIQCGLSQKEKGKEGVWICGMDKWACDDCKWGKRGLPPIRSYPTACEWCTYNDVKWFQGHCYQCPRCAYLGIKH